MMRSLANTVSDSEFWKRYAAAVDGDGVFQIASGRAHLLRYATPTDKGIAALEDSARFDFKKAREFFASAKRWAARGLNDRAAENFKYARSHHEKARQALRDRARLVAERNQEAA